MNYWIIKFSPHRTPWVEIIKNGYFQIRGVKNHQARGNLKSMNLLDKVLFYHSQSQLSVMGICEVTKTSFPDPTSIDPFWLTVQITPILSFPHPVTLSQIKENSLLCQIALVRQPRLAVVSLTIEQYDTIVKMGI
jgi:predicted RNA-binding protein with PUA-like domain